MYPLEDVQEALAVIEKFSGDPSELQLPISDTINDALGINMAQITDAILGKGWEPNGFEQHDGFRV